MTQKERLVEILDKCFIDGESRSAQTLADYLLSHGVIVPPCKVGDEVYDIFSDDRYPQIVRSVMCSDDGMIIATDGEEYWEDEFGKYIYLTREEAEKAVKEREA